MKRQNPNLPMCRACRTGVSSGAQKALARGVLPPGDEGFEVMKRKR